MKLRANSVAVKGKWLMNSSFFVYKLCPRTEEDGVLVFYFHFFLHCYLLFTVCNYKLLFHMRLSVKKKKKLSGFVFWSQQYDMGRQLERLSCVIIRQTIELAADAESSSCLTSKVLTNSVRLIICLYIWLTDRPSLSPQRCCGKRIGHAYCCIKTSLMISTFSSKKTIT